MISMTDKELDRKLKMERVEVCLNCKNFSKCEDVGKFEQCADFKEVEDEAWVIKSV